MLTMLPIGHQACNLRSRRFWSGSSAFKSNMSISCLGPASTTQHHASQHTPTEHAGSSGGFCSAVLSPSRLEKHVTAPSIPPSPLPFPPLHSCPSPCPLSLNPPALIRHAKTPEESISITPVQGWFAWPAYLASIVLNNCLQQSRKRVTR